MSPGWVRLRAPWLLVVPFFVFASPDLRSLALGAVLAVPGLAIRAWAAGTLDKGRVLATAGPYAHTRNPLYLGSLLAGLGLGIAGGSWIWPAAFALFFVAVYPGTMARESRRLEETFGARYVEYAERVPAFMPRLAPHPGADAPGRFRWERYRRNREWEALVGALAAFGALAALALTR